MDLTKETITLELDNVESMVLGRVIMERMEALATQPQSTERDAEMVVLASIATKALPQLKHQVEQERYRYDARN